MLHNLVLCVCSSGWKLEGRGQRVLNDLKSTKLSCGRMIRLLRSPPFPLQSASCLSFSQFFPVCSRSRLLTEDGGGLMGRARSQIMKAWLSINSSILSGRGVVGVGMPLCFLLCQRSLSALCVVQNNPPGSLNPYYHRLLFILNCYGKWSTAEPYDLRETRGHSGSHIP